jgi:hypothetical protein
MTQSHPAAAPAATAYADLNLILAELVNGARAALGDTFVGAWLHGSFALGEPNDASDVDWLIGVRQEPDEAQLAALQAMHSDLYDRMPAPWGQRLEGSYAPLDQLRAFTAPARPWLYLDNGARALVRSDHDDTRVVRWILREKGVVLAGPDPKTLIDPVTAQDLAANVRALFKLIAAEWLPRPARFDRRWLAAFFVTLACRMLHTLETGAVHSKPAGTAWALANLEPRWAPLIERSLARAREPLAKKLEPAERAEVAEMLAFLRYAMRLAAPRTPPAGRPVPRAAGSRWGAATGPASNGRPPPAPIRPGGRRGRG